MQFSGYGLIVGIAVVVWWSLVEYWEPRAKKVIPWILLAALVGARTYHVVDEWGYYAGDWNRIWEVWKGGLSIWGAIIGGGMVGLMTKTLPSLVLPLPLAQAVGRVANGVNGEFTNRVWGIPWWAMEAMLDLGLFAMVGRVRREWRVGGYLAGYLLIRLVLQPYR